MAQVPPSSIAPGQRVTLTITDIAFGGEGVGRIEQFVVFVPFVIVGEEVEAEIVEVKKQFARARLLRVVTSSPSRVSPRCAYFGECGGCQYQHVEYATQLEWKRKQVAGLMERIGGISQERVLAVIPCPASYGYRNRVMVRSQWDKTKQALNIGFLRADSRLVVDIVECQIAEPALNEQLRRARAQPPPKGGLKVVLRVAPEGWEVPRDSFFQNNFFLLPKLIEVVRERVRDAGSRFLVDAYCGVGFFAIELADAVEAFVGVEIDHAATLAARRNAAARGRANGQFLEGNAEALLPAILTRFDATATTVILDPPRTGCPGSGLEALRRNRPAQVLYISCHPATLARDLNVLCRESVFELSSVTPLDLFPQTQHVECVADLRHKT
ncbi:MAG TPA: TRAM domain-containing protein [Verrucomicrobiae bacterium]|nr:TRAM domain-containing protein [Verrucomicrobiae bacterium]